jgi:hypothetical protein
MTRIDLEYYPFPFLPYSKRIKTQHPDSWEELTPAQLVSAACVMMGSISDDSLIASMLSLKKRIVNRLSAYQKYTIISLLKFLDSFKPYNEFLIPEIAGYKRPLPRLKNETFGCFIFAETFFERYATTHDPEFLAKFISCLYRDGDFSEHIIAPNAARIRKACKVTQEAIFINYFLIREWYTQEYSNVFKPAENPDKKEKSSWLDVYDAIVGDDIVKADEYASLPISTVLRFLDKKIKQSENER